MRLVLASANPDKVAEIAAILEPAGVELIARPDGLADVVEDAPTLEGNARLKARAICEASGLAAVADDTGLEVDALGGAPGVRSARYAGENATYADNLRRLLGELEAVGARHPSQRRARFRTVALAVFPDGREVLAEGVVEGVIAREPRGRSGFGYDPVFVPGVEETGEGPLGTRPTFGELTADEKHAVSHRGRAFRALADALRA